MSSTRSLQKAWPLFIAAGHTCVLTLGVSYIARSLNQEPKDT